MKKEKSFFVIFLESSKDSLIRSFYMVPVIVFWIFMLFSLPLKWEGVSSSSLLYVAIIQSLFAVIEMIMVVTFSMNLLCSIRRNSKSQEEIETLGVATKAIKLGLE